MHRACSRKLAPRRKSTTSPMTSCCLPVSQPPRRALQSACAPGGKKRCRRRRVVVGGRGRGGRGRSCLRSRLWSWCGRSWSWSWWLSWLSCREMAVLSCDPARFRGRAVLGLLDGVQGPQCTVPAVVLADGVLTFPAEPGLHDGSGVCMKPSRRAPPWYRPAPRQSRSTREPGGRSSR